MVNAIPVFSKLFRGIDREEGVALMNEIGASIRNVPVGTVVVREGSPKRNFGVLLDGELSMYETDSEGRRSVVGVVQPGILCTSVFLRGGRTPSGDGRGGKGLEDPGRSRLQGRAAAQYADCGRAPQVRPQSHERDLRYGVASARADVHPFATLDNGPSHGVPPNGTRRGGFVGFYDSL